MEQLYKILWLENDHQPALTTKLFQKCQPQNNRARSVVTTVVHVDPSLWHLLA